jgi:hypothetical protein
MCRSDFERGVVPFDDLVAYVSTLASQAHRARERLLYEEVKTLFDGFVRAAVTAIESRDPTTSGHLSGSRFSPSARARGQRPSTPLPRGAVRADDHADPVRGAAPRFRQGRRPRARAGQGEEATSTSAS